MVFEMLSRHRGASHVASPTSSFSYNLINNSQCVHYWPPGTPFPLTNTTNTAAYAAPAANSSVIFAELATVRRVTKSVEANENNGETDRDRGVLCGIETDDGRK